MSDISEVQNCLICHQPLNINAPDTVDYDGQLIHAECVTAADAQHGVPPEGYNPNNSYT
jgi:hypothetical protein